MISTLRKCWSAFSLFARLFASLLALLTLLPASAQAVSFNAPANLSPQAVILNDSNITLRWGSVPGATRYTIWLSHAIFLNDGNGHCSSCIAEYTSTSNEKAISIDQANKTEQYFWLVRAEADGVTNSPWTEAYFSITFPNKLEIPYTFQVIGPIATPTVRLAWTPVNNANIYTIQLSTNASFSAGNNCNECLRTFTSITPDFSTPVLTNGSEYFWRVKAGNSDPQSGFQDSAWGTSPSFLVQGKLATPANHAPANGTVLSGVSTTLSWGRVANADSYLLQVRNGPEFYSGDPGTSCFDCLIDQKINGTQFTLPTLALATGWSWRVRAESSTPALYRPSDWIVAQFRVAGVDAPVLTGPANGSSISTLAPVLSWRAANNATSYKVEVSVDPNFSLIYPALVFCYGCEAFSSTTTTTSFSPPLWLDHTTYYWRVKGINNQVESAWNSGQFTVHTNRPALATPQILTPAIGATVVPDQFIMTWTTVPDAYWYQVQVSKEPVFHTSENGYVCSNCIANHYGLNFNVVGLENGKTYYWRVRAYANNSQDSAAESAWSEGRFTVQQPGNKLQTPVIGLPVQDGIFSSLGGVLSWEPVSSGSFYRVLIAETPDMVFDEASQSCALCVYNNLEFEAKSLPRNLAVGKTYYWQVRTEATSTQRVLPSDWARSRFNVVDKFFYPFTSGNNSFDAGSNVNLRWVSLYYNANRFRVLVSSSNPVWSDATQSCTNCLFDRVVSGNNTDVGILPPGQNYYWQVRAEADSTHLASDWSSDLFFVKPLSALPKLAIPKTLLPIDESTISSGLAQLSWEAVNRADGYTLQISLRGFSEDEDDAACSHCLYNQYHAGTTSITTPNLLQNISNDNRGVAFYWRVRAANNLGQTSGWHSASFITAAPSCITPLSPGRMDASGIAGSTRIIVRASSNCIWNVANDASWIKLAIGSRTGSATLELSYLANPDINARQATILIDGQPFILHQEGVGPSTASEAVISIVGQRSDFSVVKTNSGYTVIDHSGQQAARTLAHARRLLFSNGSVAFDIDGAAGKAYRLYQAAFDRQPDLAGLGFWIKGIDGGTSLLDVARQFLNSGEFKSLYGNNPANNQLVTLFYSHVLHRTPDAAGFAYWKKILDQYPDLAAQVLVDFSESAENKDQTAESVKNGIDFIP